MKFINDLKWRRRRIGISNQYNYVVCGHIHQPKCVIVMPQGKIMRHLNSGDWMRKSYCTGIHKRPMGIVSVFDEAAWLPEKHAAEEEDEPTIPGSSPIWWKKFNLLRNWWKFYTPYREQAMVIWAVQGISFPCCNKRWAGYTGKRYPGWCGPALSC